MKRSLLLFLAACNGTPMLPETPRQDLKETIHGVVVEDPYRWLEDGKSPQVQAWADAHHARTRAALDAVPARAEIRRRIEELNSVGAVMSPAIRGGRIFYQKRTALQNQPVLWVRDPGPRVLLDPNTLSTDATTAIDWWVPSDDGRLVAWGSSEGGSELSTLRVLDVDGAVKFAEAIPNCRAASVAWLRNNSGFYYTRHPEGEPYYRRVYFHRLGTDWRSDPLVFGDGRAKEDWPSVALSPLNGWLLVTVRQGWSKSELYLKPLPEGDWVPVVEGRNQLYGATVLDDRLLIWTDEGAPRHRIFAADVRKPGRSEWREILPEGDANLDGFTVAGGKIVTRELHRATSRLRVFTIDGRAEGEIPVPPFGTVGSLDGEPGSPGVVFDYTSFFAPSSLWHWDGALRPIEEIHPNADVSRFVARQVEVASKDGTKITMFVLHRKDLRFPAPTLLYGYGGFSVSLTPGFSGSRLQWLERGGVFAMPNLRGGGEYGEEWHRAGMLANKQNSFDDFVAAAEWLVRAGVATPERLAIAGGSNGGLLVGAALTQRPELFRAVVCAVPLLDMVRYHRFLIARLWIPEYGSAEDPAQFRWLHAYSPYHRLRAGVRYPAVLLLTADFDTRVDPAHARKFAARLLECGGTAYLRVEKKAGHGAGKPLAKAIDEAADQYAFLEWQLFNKNHR